MLAACFAAVAAGSSRYVIIACPDDRAIKYSELPSFDDLLVPEASRTKETLSVLVDGAAAGCQRAPCPAGQDQGLQTPQSVAVATDKAGGRTLYVADSTLGSIFAYSIGTSALGGLSAGAQTVILSSVTAQWLAADSYGNLFYSAGASDSDGTIMKVTAEQLQSSAPKPVMLASAQGGGTSTVSSPGGLAVDNYFVFWANKLNGKSVGSVVQAFDEMKRGHLADANFPRALALNLDVTYGVCSVRDFIFFTGETTSLYAVKKTGGTIAEVSSAFREPRGCTYDGESSLLVADTGANAIYSLPANIRTLRSVSHRTKVVDVNKPAGIAVLIPDGAARHGLSALIAGLATAVVLATSLGP